MNHKYLSVSFQGHDWSPEYWPLIGHSPDDDDEVLHWGEVLSVRQPHAQGQGLRLSGATDNEILKKQSFINYRDI